MWNVPHGCTAPKWITPQEPPRKDGLPLCGFPFGSVDHLPAFLPELQVSLPTGQQLSWLLLMVTAKGWLTMRILLSQY